MRFSVCMPWRDSGDDPARVRNYDATLARWAPFARAHGGEIVLGDSAHDRFNLAASRNNAVAKAKSDALVIVDIDMIPTDFGHVLGCLNRVAETKHVVMPAERLWVSTREATESFFADRTADRWKNYFARVREPGGHAVVWPGPTAGILVIHRYTYDRVGGFDERFVWVGHEDTAFHRAINTLTGWPERADGDMVHLWHESHTDQRPEWVYPEENRLLAKRYERVRGNAKAMRRLVNEHLAAR